MTCTEFMAQMTDYFDGEIDPELLEEIRAHLQDCDHCEVLVSTTRQTIQIYRNQQMFELPMERREAMISNIVARCRKGC